MSTGSIDIVVPTSLDDTVRSGDLHEALVSIAELAGAHLSFAQTAPIAAVCTEGQAAPPDHAVDDDSNEIDAAELTELAIEYRGSPRGSVAWSAYGSNRSQRQAANAIRAALNYALDREAAVDDLADEMIACYEELNMLYALTPNIATRTHASDVGQALVEETARTLRCRRVSLLVVDESRQNLRVLASRGLPADVQSLALPIGGTIAGHTLSRDSSLIVNDLSVRPDLLELARGGYESDSFAVVRMPLTARGEALGILTATERIGAKEFTARDRKLLEGLSAIGASALLNCRLHDANNRRMVSTIRALASAVDAKDQYTHDHSSRVAQLAVATARELNLKNVATLREVELAGLLHDIGKIGIPDAILAKAGRLTPEEFAIVQKHADIGASIVEHVDGLERVAQAIRHHHERFDGLGYPLGLSGETIPLASRLIAVVDVFDCLTSDRPYRARIDHEQALRELERSKGTQLDPEVVDTFLRVMNRETESAQPNTRQHA